MERVSKNKTDIIFDIGLFFVPFENFFFAPSAGWAAISPIIFFVYLMVNIKYMGFIIKKYKNILILIALGIMISLINFLSIGFSLSNFINSLISLMLGLTSLFSLTIYYEKNKDNPNTMNKIIKILFISYLITMFVGVLQYITIKGNIGFLYKFFNSIFKRNSYLNYHRIQFFFTEPSFIGMHLYGILLPLFLYTKSKKIIKLIIFYALLAIAFSSGVRIILDSSIIAIMFIFGYLFKKKKYFIIFLLPIVLLFSFNYFYNNNIRVKHIVDNGIYADGSLASRYFRINASIHGYIKNPFRFITGYGIGNSIYPIKEGYAIAFSNYKSSFLKEIYELGDPNYNDESASYCLYTRIISEYGFIYFIIIILYLIKITQKSIFDMKWYYLFTILYIYLQFESYAFYALWIFIFIMIYSKKKEELL